MKPLVSFSSMLRAELYKTLRNGRILMNLLSPLAIYLLLFFYVTYKGQEGLFNYTMPVYEGDPWLMLWSRYTLPFFSLFIPIAVVTLSYLICEIEFQNDNIRALFAHPIAKWKLYLSKTSVLSLLIAIFSILIWLCFVLGGYLLELLIPAYPFGAYAVWGPSIAVWGRAIPAMLLIGVFGLIVSLLSRNFTLPVLLALFFTVLAVFTSNEPAGKYLPFTTLTYLASPHTVAELTAFSERDVINLLFLCISPFIGYRCFTPEKRSLLRNHIH